MFVFVLKLKEKINREVNLMGKIMRGIGKNI